MTTESRAVRAGPSAPDGQPWTASPHLRDGAISLLSVLSLLALWLAGSWILPPSALPGPTAVATALVGNMVSGTIWPDIGITLWRIVLAFVVAMSLSSALGFAMGLSRRLDVFFRVWIVCGLTMPALVVILTMYMMVGLNEGAAILGAAFSIAPILAVNIREGVKSIDTRLIGMAQAFRASRRQKILQVVVPQVAPMLLASTRFGLGLIWKMILFAELLGRGEGVGYKIEFYYQMFNMTQVLAHALSFLVVMLFIEVAILGTLERRIFRWRG